LFAHYLLIYLLFAFFFFLTPEAVSFKWDQWAQSTIHDMTWHAYEWWSRPVSYFLLYNLKIFICWKDELQVCKKSIPWFLSTEFYAYNCMLLVAFSTYFNNDQHKPFICPYFSWFVSKVKVSIESM
jgi:hypothetical protein